MADDPAALIAAIRHDIDSAADAVLTAAEKGLRYLRAAREGQADALAGVEQMLCTVLEACAFQDIAGQRLSNLEAALAGAAAGDPLMNGPALSGGLLQSDADALLPPAPQGD